MDAPDDAQISRNDEAAPPAAALRSPPSGSEAAAQVAAAQASALKSAAESGVPFCEECEQARRELARQRSS